MGEGGEAGKETQRTRLDRPPPAAVPTNGEGVRGGAGEGCAQWEGAGPRLGAPRAGERGWSGAGVGMAASGRKKQQQQEAAAVAAGGAGRKRRKVGPAWAGWGSGGGCPARHRADPALGPQLPGAEEKPRQKVAAAKLNEEISSDSDVER